MALFGPNPDIVAKLGLIKLSCSLKQIYYELEKCLLYQNITTFLTIMFFVFVPLRTCNNKNSKLFCFLTEHQAFVTVLLNGRDKTPINTEMIHYGNFFISNSSLNIINLVGFIVTLNY